MQKNKHLSVMFKKLKELYKTYEPYIRVDLIMYGVMIVMIIVYLVFFS
jgi:flagellar biosynthesis/type III secretory pathway M-ring protein FliF/YscJ